MHYQPLGEFQKCNICGERDFAGRHTCKPRFEARYEHTEDSDFVGVYAADGLAAAIQYHDDRFSDTDYATDVTVIVRNDQGQRATFDVHVEAVPEFSAKQKGEWGQPEPDPNDEPETEQEN